MRFIHLYQDDGTPTVHGRLLEGMVDDLLVPHEYCACPEASDLLRTRMIKPVIAGQDLYFQITPFGDSELSRQAMSVSIPSIAVPQRRARQRL